MEFNARYTLIAAFSIAVLLALFGFVFWLNTGGGLGEKDEYTIRFSVPVSGMANGSNVLFNGLKVGEVTSLQLDVDNPGEFTANISIDMQTPHSRRHQSRRQLSGPDGRSQCCPFWRQQGIRKAGGR